MYACDVFNCVVVGCAWDGCCSRGGGRTTTEEQDFGGSSGSSAWDVVSSRVIEETHSRAIRSSNATDHILILYIATW
jgi:hypothetical protein